MKLKEDLRLKKSDSIELEAVRGSQKRTWVARLRHMNGEAFEKSILRKLWILKDLNIFEKTMKKFASY
jgi:hypothetical protein